jgi:hypothetical protein
MIASTTITVRLTVLPTASWICQMLVHWTTHRLLRRLNAAGAAHIMRVPESVRLPLDETRAYVKLVLRNLGLYERLYAAS